MGNISGVQQNESNSNQKKTGFGFLKKKNPEQSNTNTNDMGIQNNANVVSQMSNDLVNSNDNSNVSATPKNKFTFIKSKNNPTNTNANTNNLNSYNTPENYSQLENHNTNDAYSNNRKPDFANLDNLLNEKENYFNSIIGNENPLNTSHNQNESYTSNKEGNENRKQSIGQTAMDSFNPSNVERKSNDLSSQLQQLSSNKVELPKESKKGFGFVLKKKTEPQLLTSDRFDSGNVNTDDNWDNRSLKSLNINNNIKSDNIVMHIDKDDEDTKSIKNMNDISSITNPMKESPMYIAPVQTFKSESQKSNVVSSFQTSNPEQMKKKCYEEISKSEDSVKEMILKFHSIKVKLKAKEEELTKINENCQLLVEREEDAIANNNFDEAQNIENMISDNKSKIEKVKTQIEDLKAEINNYREHELLIIRKKVRILDETSAAFKKVKSQQEYELETFQSTDVNRHKNDNIKIKKLKEKLDFLKTNLDSDKNYIDEEEEKITKVIKSQSSGVFEELDELNISKNLILEEIENLKRQLDQKYSELDNINKAVESKEIEIDAIKSNFNHEFNKLNYKKKNYEESKKDFEDQQNTYHKMVKSYENDQTKFEEKTKNMKNTISEFENELNEFKNQLSSLNEDLNKKEYLLKNENEILSKLHLIEMKYEKIKNSKDSNLTEIQKLEFANKKFEAEILGWDMKIPTLEEEKKGYVALKNFKEAGRVSNELKSFIENKNKNLSKIEENLNKISELKLENENINDELTKVDESRILEIKELNITKYDYLLTYLEQLQKCYEVSRNKNFSNISQIEQELKFIEEEKTELEKFDYILEKFPKLEEITNQEEMNKSQSEKLEETNVNNKSVCSQNGEEESPELKENDTETISMEIKDEIKQDEDEPKEEDNLNNSHKSQENENAVEELNEEEINFQLNVLNNQIQQCIEEEDFDNADIVQKQIDELTNKLSLVLKNKL